MKTINEYYKYLQDYKDGDIPEEYSGDAFFTADSIYCKWINEAKGWQEQVTRAIINSFGQHHLPLMYAYSNDIYEEFLDTTDKVSLSDNHQIWWPKDTIVRDWFRTQPMLIAKNIPEPTSITTIQDLTDIVVAYLKTIGWKNSRYTVKHFVKNLSLCDNKVNPNSFVECGTGARGGLDIIFPEYSPFTNKTKQKRFMDILINGNDLINEHKYYNHEAHLCYYWKYKKSSNYAGINKVQINLA